VKNENTEAPVREKGKILHRQDGQGLLFTLPLLFGGQKIQIETGEVS
jgi:hypothetical protein